MKIKPNAFLLLILVASTVARPDNWSWGSDSSKSEDAPATVTSTTPLTLAIVGKFAPKTDGLKPSMNRLWSNDLSRPDENGKLSENGDSEKISATSEAASDDDETVDSILTSTRDGKIINTYTAIYDDPSVKEALKNGDDVQARSFIKEKLCKLGFVKEVASFCVSTKKISMTPIRCFIRFAVLSGASVAMEFDRNAPSLHLIDRFFVI